MSARDPATFPDYRDPGYRSTRLRGPDRPAVVVRPGRSETTGPGPVLGRRWGRDADLTTNATGERAIGQRIIVTGRVLDADGRPVPDAAIEVWQANAAGYYRHPVDSTDNRPLDPNFTGRGLVVTDRDGNYAFTSIRPGAYPWGNHPNAWRPAHIHLSLFGDRLTQRLVTQMYFEGDPLQPLDPILNAVPEPARHRLVAAYDHDVTVPDWALGYHFDIVLRGPNATPPDPEHADG